MSNTLISISGALIAEKAVGANLDYTADYSSGMATGETLINSVWTSAPPDLVLTAASYTATTVSVFVAGGLSDTWYTVANLATGDGGTIHDFSFSLYVSDPAQLGSGLSLPFPSIPGALAALRRDRLLILSTNFFPGVDIDNSYLLSKLTAATAFIQRKLRVFLQPTEMLPNTATQDEQDALTQAGNRIAMEPAYDYSPDLFQGNQWGFQPLRQRPIIAVHSMRFVYPTPGATLWSIPNEWIRMDKKYGTINLLPVTAAFSLPLNAFILSALGGGRMVPNFLEIRYRCGLENIDRDWPDIIDVIFKQTVLSIVEDCFIPSTRSDSTSADGLSQSASIGLKMEDYAKIIDSKLDTIQQALFGIRIGVV